ncbi:MAG: CHAD domain-containing protein [Candidatus Dormibacteraeota bacterium]|nr:CHAD domain-containing protein [Candidatus Dormibacteraeota bacterium]
MTTVPTPSGVGSIIEAPPSGERWTLVAGPQFRAPDLSAVDGVITEPSELSLLRTTYHDTADLRILRWGGELRHDAGRGWTVLLGDGERGAQHVSQLLHFADSPLVPAEAIDLLTAFTRRAPIRPVLRTRTERSELRITGTDGIVHGRLRDDLITVMQGRRIATRFREIEVVDSSSNGGAGSVAALVEALRGAGAAPSPASGTAIRAMGAVASAPPDVAVPQALAHSSGAAAIRRAIAQSVSRLILHDAAVREGIDPEGVHQARVATRRLRSDLRTFAPLLDAAWVSSLREELHGIADLLGAVRDGDVLLGRLRAACASLPESERESAASIIEALQGIRTQARERLLESMRDPAYVRLLDDLVAAANTPPTVPEASGDAAALLPPLARKPWRRLRRLVESLPEEPPDADLHQVRISAKRARYAAEAVAAVARPGVEEFAGAVAAVQDVLGDHHDAVVAEQWLRETGAATSTDPLVLGELIGLERATAADRRAAWRPAWRAARKAHPHTWA